MCLSSKSKACAATPKKDGNVVDVVKKLTYKEKKEAAEIAAAVTTEQIAALQRKLANRKLVQEYNAREKAKRDADPEYETVFANGTTYSNAHGSGTIHKSTKTRNKAGGKWSMPSQIKLANGATLHKSKSTFVGRKLVNAALSDEDF